MRIPSLCAVICLLSYSTITFSLPEKSIVLTIDDLPFVGSANYDPKKLAREHDRFVAIMQALIDHQVPAIGFVIAGSIEKGQWELLESFKSAGFLIGNHTYSHKSLEQTNTQTYIQDVARADKILEPIISTPKYFRFPYLSEGHGEKKQAVRDYLAAHNYRIAPVNIDSKDFKFNSQLFAIPYRLRPARLPALEKRYIQYVWQQTQRAEKQNPEHKPLILLIHSNLLNSHCLGGLIQMYKDQGYTIVDIRDVVTEDLPKTQTLSQVLFEQHGWYRV
ncbi:MAG: polysaccharide deacetylase family protein [Legionellaceae bacterium]|nr:polysaccharide deacetylase family protein [Legionellaceae bacterium]